MPPPALASALPRVSEAFTSTTSQPSSLHARVVGVVGVVVGVVACAPLQVCVDGLLGDGMC
jgi:hypothetical protein